MHFKIRTSHYRYERSFKVRLQQCLLINLQTGPLNAGAHVSVHNEVHIVVVTAGLWLAAWHTHKTRSVLAGPCEYRTRVPYYLLAICYEASYSVQGLCLIWNRTRSMKMSKYCSKLTNHIIKSLIPLKTQTHRWPEHVFWIFKCGPSIALTRY